MEADFGGRLVRGIVQVVLGLIIGVIGALWAGPAKSMLADATAAIPGGFGEAVPLALAFAGGLYVVTGVITMVLSGIHNLMSQGAQRKKELKQLGVFHELLTGVAVRMVGADGVIAPAEMTMVSSVLEKFGQSPIAEKTIRSIATAAAKDPEKYLALMADKQGSITDEQKTRILRAGLLVAMADVTVHDAEIEYLQKAAEALKVPPEQLGKIRDELTNVTQKLVGAAAFAA
jgi:uncharacterized tellurite resistance protein B-like protein